MSSDMYDKKIARGTLKMCPRYMEFLKKSQKDLIHRYSKHNKCRSQCIKLCVDETLFELCNVSKLQHLSRIKVPTFVEKDDILSESIREMNCLINKTPTVQASKCKEIIKTYQEFTKKAKNKQDQNSWKVSGEYFFVPYIYSFIEFVENDYLSFVNEEKEKEEILQLCGIIFALKLLKKKVKFERAREKPLIRDRTLVNSSCLHYAFKALHKKLNIPKFYLIEKAKRKQIKKQIISHQFHHNICQFAQYLFDNNNNNNINNNINHGKNDYDFPNDWIHIQNENKNKNRIFQSTANSLFCMDSMQMHKNCNKNRKIKQEIHIKQMRNIPFNDNNENNNNNNTHNGGFKLKFDVLPTTINRIGSETIMNGEINTNDMGYSFNN